MKLKEINHIINKDGYFTMGHGTGRSGNSIDVVNSILKNGLRTKDNSLYYTAIGLDTGNMEKLENKLNNWEHLGSRYIILLRFPIDYVNVMGESADLDGEKYGSFMIQRQIDGSDVNYVDPKFILGYYDALSDDFVMNHTFEDELSEDSINELKSRYKHTLEKTKKRLERLEEGYLFDTSLDEDTVKRG